MYILGADIGTEGTKVVLVDQDGAVVVAQYVSYQYDTPSSGWTEQSPVVWWNAFRQGVQRLWSAGVQPEEIAGVGVTGQMHSPILLNRNGDILRKSILWNDSRATEICYHQALTNSADNGDVQGHYMDLLPGFTGASLLWIQDNEPCLFDEIARIMLPKDFINFQLTGVFCTESSDASGTGVFDLEAGDWNEALIHRFGFRRDWFAPVVSSSSIIGSVTMKAAQVTGLLAGIPVIAGAADNAASMIGTGILAEGEGMLTVGTSGAVITPVKHLRKVNKSKSARDVFEGLPLHLYSHVLPHTWLAAGCSLSAGASLRWFKDTFAHGQTYNEVLKGVEDVPPGSEGVIFLPFLTGNRSVHTNLPFKASFTGLGLNHSFTHLARAVLEGVAFSLRDSLELIQDHLRVQLNSLVLTGGVIKSSIWPQILCDVLGIPLSADENYQGGAYGVAMLVGQALGYWDVSTFDVHSYDVHSHDAPYYAKARRTVTFYPTAHASTYEQVYRAYRKFAHDLYRLPSPFLDL